MRSLLRSDAREIFEANQEAAWRAFREGQPCPVVVRVPPQFVPLGTDVAPQKQDRQHVVRFVPGYLSDKPAYCVTVDDTPALEDQLVATDTVRDIWDVHAAQVASPGPRGRRTAYPEHLPPGYALNPNSSSLVAGPDYDVATQSDATLSPKPEPVDVDLAKIITTLLRWGCYLIAASVAVHLVGWWLGWPGPVWQR